jgi:hypothetical protein
VGHQKLPAAFSGPARGILVAAGGLKDILQKEGAARQPCSR